MKTNNTTRSWIFLTYFDDDIPSSLLVSQIFSEGLVGSGMLQHHQRDGAHAEHWRSDE